MRRLSDALLFFVLAISVATPSCQRSSDEVYNDTQSAGKHVSRGIKTLGGKHGESRAVKSRGEFAATDTRSDDFVSMDDNGAQNLSIKDGDNLAQSRNTPGELGSGIPGIDAFKNPSDDPELAAIFQNVLFEYNSSLIKGDDNLNTVQKIAEYMRAHPNVYIFVEGHCDKRGPAAYNLALGANRANSVRNCIAKEGVNPDNIFTISYGKERQIADGDTEEFFRLNRRAQFRIWER